MFNVELKRRPWNDLLCVEWNVKPYSVQFSSVQFKNATLTPMLLHRHASALWRANVRWLGGRTARMGIIAGWLHRCSACETRHARCARPPACPPMESLHGSPRPLYISPANRSTTVLRGAPATSPSSVTVEYLQSLSTAELMLSLTDKSDTVTGDTNRMWKYLSVIRSMTTDTG